MRSANVFLPFLITALASLNAATPVKIVLAGDSTVNPEGGWGPGFRASFDKDVLVINLAANGRSSKSFRDEGRWKQAIEAKPAFILIQFGHNDVPGKGPERETDPHTSYKQNLIRYVEEAKQAGATPVLVTSIVRRNFDAGDNWKPDSLVPYVETVRALGAELHIPVMDLYRSTEAQARQLGNAGCEAQVGALDKDGKPDHTHLGPQGQASIGAMAAKEFARLFPEFEKRRHELTPWRKALDQAPDWYWSAEAIRIAGNLLAFQHENGGFEKNIDMALPLESPRLDQVLKRQPEGETTIDNDATWTQMRYLAKVHLQTHDPRYAAALRKGLRYLLAAQYPNGGWPQFYPLRHGYWDHITYNDDAMIGVMDVLRDIAEGEAEWALFTPEERRLAEAAMRRGIAVILKTQVRVNGKLTAWCAQHDEVTLAPAMARKYELISLSGSESVGIVEFLMGISHPAPEIIDAVQGAVGWFAHSKIDGIEMKTVPAPGTPKGTDRVVVANPAAPALWARFYEIETNRPMFSGRDSVKKYSMAEIEYERRNGYSWYVTRPAKLLSRDYPEWRKKWSITTDARE
jgi:PelA/Pel-15E family pectate lyase